MIVIRVVTKIIRYTVFSAILWYFTCTPVFINKMAVAQLNNGEVSQMMPFYNKLYMYGPWIFAILLIIFIVDIFREVKRTFFDDRNMENME